MRTRLLKYQRRISLIDAGARHDDDLFARIIDQLTQEGNTGLSRSLLPGGEQP